MEQLPLEQIINILWEGILILTFVSSFEIHHNYKGQIKFSGFNNQASELRILSEFVTILCIYSFIFIHYWFFVVA